MEPSDCRLGAWRRFAALFQVLPSVKARTTPSAMPNATQTSAALICRLLLLCTSPLTVVVFDHQKTENNENLHWVGKVTRWVAHGIVTHDIHLFLLHLNRCCVHHMTAVPFRAEGLLIADEKVQPLCHLLRTALTSLPPLFPVACYPPPLSVACHSGAGRSAVAECLHSALKIIAVQIVNVLVPRPATKEKQKRWANTAAWWILVTQVGLGKGRPDQDLHQWREVD